MGGIYIGFGGGRYAVGFTRGSMTGGARFCGDHSAVGGGGVTRVVWFNGYPWFLLCAGLRAARAWFLESARAKPI